MASRPVPQNWNPSARRRELFWRWVDIGGPDECWPWLLHLDDKGYGHATVEGWRTTAHRIAYALDTGHLPDGLVVMHSCDFRPCCNPAHLDAATQAANLDDMRRKGRAGDHRVFGEQHGRCKVTDAQVFELKILRESGWTQQQLATLFGVGQSQIGRILRGENRSIQLG